MPGKTPQNNGNEPIENGIKNNGDVEMQDSGKAKGKKGAKEGDDEMTVVVPISKGSKEPSKQSRDAEGDVAMADDDAANDGEKVDPVAQTVAGKLLRSANHSYHASRAIRLLVPWESVAQVHWRKCGLVFTSRRFAMADV